jgi:DNA-binding response OmpR family regulator
MADNVLTAIRKWGGSVSRQCKQLYEFGPFRLDTEERQLLREEKPVPLTPKAYQTLRILVENSGELVAKEELMRQVWPDAFVEEGGLTRNISALRGSGVPGKRAAARTCEAGLERIRCSNDIARHSLSALEARPGRQGTEDSR